MLSQLAKALCVVDKCIIIDLEVTLKLLEDGSVLSRFTLQDPKMCQKNIII